MSLVLWREDFDRDRQREICSEGDGHAFIVSDSFRSFLRSDAQPLIAILCMMDSPPNGRYNLQRFLEAQEATFAGARAELAAGEKRTHWMWFIFPQIRGLGSSSTAQLYAISNLDEARAYLAQPLLGSRLRECTTLVNLIDGRTLQQIFGSPDDRKFHSSMTLFACAAEENESEFRTALWKYFGGSLDRPTIRRL